MIPEESNLAGVNATSFKIVLNENWNQPKDQYIIGCDPYQVEEPLNFWHKILSKMKMKHKTKYVGWEYTVLKLSEIEGKLVAEYKGRDL